MDEQYCYFRALVTVILQNEERLSRTVYSFQSDSVGREDTLDGIEQIVGDLMQVAPGFDTLVDRIEIREKRLITEQEYYAAPNSQRYP